MNRETRKALRDLDDARDEVVYLRTGVRVGLCASAIGAPVATTGAFVGVGGSTYGWVCVAIGGLLLMAGVCIVAIFAEELDAARRRLKKAERRYEDLTLDGAL
ncbi:hypothetical protein SAMN05421776_11714 [Nocardia farcinica]|uniref:Uncharacterized protein n=1 Tax=Nocardia farcinica TaxID=37329 RepID=A0A0H5PB73_NOCFR|nr:hypothetical protein [Nocardia farcinica]AXK86572.1 hypothetical protein DXT66_13880 [Nocardia farcinica]PFW99021.1 hypothetical protein CJ469_05621 [Nocardia farcinica]PFX06059.1 hypothetical protein CJ468_04919 [Nocardia farcinica]CRY79851.1 Uncharacterised protein [Nocardia farcinica]SIT33575.1 hypothetical protein SAMN05421776_11714 [Nocardia farcinica]